ncbi:MAG: hypothetical protein OEU36_01940 [Gammaproteobacteria bacterium]|nr:hypothetical protein [Gammaproteobacteria bacterium]
MVASKYRSLLLCASFATSLAQADATIEFLIKDAAIDTEPELQTAYVKAGRVMVKNAGGTHTTDVLFDSSQQNFAIIDHDRRSFMFIDKQSMEGVANEVQGMMDKMREQMAAKMEDMSPEEAAKFEQMLSGMLPEHAPPSTKEFIDTGDTKSVNDFECRIYQVLDNGKPQAQICAAGRTELGLPPQDYKALKSMHIHADELAAKAASMAGPLASQIPRLGSKEVDGIPVEVKDSSGGNTVETSLVSVSVKSVPSNLVEIPEGYKLSHMPSLSQ